MKKYRIFGGGDDIEEEIKYYIMPNTPGSNIDDKVYSEFIMRTKEVLSASEWHKYHKFGETSNEAEATITMELATNDKISTNIGEEYYDYNMINIYKDVEKPTDKKVIKFSTTSILGNKRHIRFNLDNWLSGVPESGLSTDQYREYVINHEFGHGLGYDHQKCVDGVCPVMYQATRGCPVGTKCGSKVQEIDTTVRWFMK